MVHITTIDSPDEYPSRHDERRGGLTMDLNPYAVEQRSLRAWLGALLVHVGTALAQPGVAPDESPSHAR